LNNQGPRSGLGSPSTPIKPGQTFTVWAIYRNSGTAIWSKSGANPVRLGNSNPQDRGSAFMGGQNLRTSLVNSTVRPGQNGVFKITLTAPSSGGTYVETFRPLAEGLTWMGNDVSFTFNVSGGQSSGGTAGQKLLSFFCITILW